MLGAKMASIARHRRDNGHKNQCRTHQGGIVLIRESDGLHVRRQNLLDRCSRAAIISSNNGQNEQIVVDKLITEAGRLPSLGVQIE